MLIVFGIVFKHTKHTAYIQTSRRMADYFIDNLPSDGVVPWYGNLYHPVSLGSCYARPLSQGLQRPFGPATSCGFLGSDDCRERNVALS